MKTLSFLIIALIGLNSASIAKTTAEKTTIYFNTADYRLTEAAIVQLNELLQKAQNCPDFELFIEGHTDSRGGISYNDQLSRNRSEAVKNYLIANGIAKKYLTMKFKGELAPILPNSNDDNRELNRRVELTFTSYSFESIEELEEELGKSSQQNIVVDPKKETTIHGKNGVRAYIPKNSFRLANGDTVTEPITVELTEALNTLDFIGSGLLTRADDQMLETGGMVRMTAKTSSGEKVELVEGAELILAVPSIDRQNNMEVFTSSQGDNWIPTNREISTGPGYEMKRPFPSMKTKKLVFPKFTYSIKEPIEPREPVAVLTPHKPRASSYIHRMPWYVVNKAKKRKREIKSYEKALERYDKRMLRYDRLNASYEKKKARFDDEFASYEIELENWKSNKEKAFEAFKRTPEYVQVLKKQDAINELILDKYAQAVDKWRADRRELAIKWGENLNEMGMTTENAMNNYVFAVSKMDWINVDRFYKMNPRERKTLVMSSDDALNEKVLVLFKNINSILQCGVNVEENTFKLNNFPKKEEAYIFAYKVENNRPLMCFMAVDQRSNYQLEYIETSFVEIKAILGELGNVG